MRSYDRNKEDRELNRRGVLLSRGGGGEVLSSVFFLVLCCDMVYIGLIVEMCIPYSVICWTVVGICMYLKFNPYNHSSDIYIVKARGAKNKKRRYQRCQRTNKSKMQPWCSRAEEDTKRKIIFAE